MVAMPTSVEQVIAPAFAQGRSLPIAVEPDLHDNRHAAIPHYVLHAVCQATDALSVAVAAELGLGLQAALTQHGSGFAIDREQWMVAAIVGTVTMLAALRSGQSYQIDRLLKPLLDLGRAGRAVILGAGVQAGVLFILARPHSDVEVLAPALCWGAMAASCLTASRGIAALQLARLVKRGRLTRQVAIVGANDVSAAFIARAAADPWTRIVGVFDDQAAGLAPQPGGHRVNGTVADLVQQTRQHRVDSVILTVPYADTAALAALKRRLRSVVADVAVVAGAADTPAAAEAITMLAGNPVVVVSQQRLAGGRLLVKTMFDRVGAAALLVATLPLLLLIALAIKLDSPGPVLFRQQREGFNNTLFTILKFRTMTHGGHDQAAQATRRDRRITRVGAALRRLSLDELPQLLNVLRGDMSLVGPRPHLPTTRAAGRTFHQIVPSYAARHQVRPGITGWAQVQGLRGEIRTERDITDRVACDLDYIDAWSLRLDLRILLLTISKEIVSRSGNAY